MKITVHDIAKKTGFSQSTVSKVLNDYPTISEATKRKVQEAIKELGFVPNLVARSMVKKKSGTIGLIVGDIANPFFSETSKVIISNSRDFGIDVIISDTDYDPKNMENAIEIMLARRVDGILIASIERNDEYVEKLREDNVPVILYNRKTDDEQTSYVVLNNKKGSELAIHHIVDLGHEKICYISGSRKFSTFNERYEGFAEALQSKNIKINKKLVYEKNNPEENLSEFINKVLKMDVDRPTCFFAATDNLAIKIIEILTEHGYNVPNDFSVIGYDDIEISSNPVIGLTTVSQNKKMMAQIALEKLITQIDLKNKPSKPVQIMIEPELKIRKTTKRIKQLGE